MFLRSHHARPQRTRSPTHVEFDVEHEAAIVVLVIVTDGAAGVVFGCERHVGVLQGHLCVAADAAFNDVVGGWSNVVRNVSLSRARNLADARLLRTSI